MPSNWRSGPGCRGRLRSLRQVRLVRGPAVSGHQPKSIARALGCSPIPARRDQPSGSLSVGCEGPLDALLSLLRRVASIHTGPRHQSGRPGSHLVPSRVTETSDTTVLPWPWYTTSRRGARLAILGLPLASKVSSAPAVTGCLEVGVVLVPGRRCSETVCRYATVRGVDVPDRRHHLPGSSRRCVERGGSQAHHGAGLRGDEQLSERSLAVLADLDEVLHRF